jgi:ribosomal protein S18 acetylase RimI-like enzyme
MIPFHFSNEHTSSEVGGIVDVLKQPRLWIPTEHDYPNHTVWLDKTEAQIASGEKHAMAARMGDKAVGAVIYRQNPDDPTIVDIRNISVADDARGRYVGSFLLRNVEVEAAKTDFPDATEFLVDTKTTNTDMIAFLLSHGYTIKEITDLYGLGTGLDVVLTKPVQLV